MNHLGPYNYHNELQKPQHLAGKTKATKRKSEGLLYKVAGRFQHMRGASFKQKTFKEPMNISLRAARSTLRTSIHTPISSPIRPGHKKKEERKGRRWLKIEVLKQLRERGLELPKFMISCK